MKRETRDHRERTLYQHLGLFSPSSSQLAASRERIRERLRASAESSAPAAWAEPLPRTRRDAWRTGASLAAAALLFLIVSVGDWNGTNALARLEAEDGSVFLVSGGREHLLRQGASIDVNDVIRSNGGAGAMLALADGSRVEMRSQSELSLQRADDGLRIRLRSGGIIVEAVRQRTGHLHVQTSDIAVSVVGTVFLVNAADDGSRVGVIEGEVRVRELGTPPRRSGRQGATETTLRPGEQVATSPTLAARPLTEAVAWSRRGDAYLAILANFETGMANTSGPLRPLNDVNAALGQVGPATASREFEEASIRECDPDNVPPPPADARGGGANSFYMTPGRTYALCMTLATLIRTAYGYAPADFVNDGGRGRAMNVNLVYGLGVEDGRRVRGGPDWVRTDYYTIEAVAGGPADAETMRGPMLRALLERRFQLSVHVEAEQVPAFDLTVAPGGLKIRPVPGSGVSADGFVSPNATSDACEPPPTPTPGVPTILLPRTVAEVRRGEKPSCGLSLQANGPNQAVVAGAVGLVGLARALGGALGNVQVFDKTGVTDRFNIVLEFARDANAPGRGFLIPEPDQPSDVPPAATIFTAIEEQLGLRLEPARGSREFIVIDHVERPSAN